MTKLALHVNDEVLGELRKVAGTPEGGYELILYWPHQRVAVHHGPVDEASLRPVDDPGTTTLRFETPEVYVEDMTAVHPSTDIHVRVVSPTVINDELLAGLR
jgi:hypothetical protein